MPSKKKSTQSRWQIASLLLATILLLVGVTVALAQEDLPPEKSADSLFHPTFPFLDENGENVLDSGKTVSTMQTCGACHDA
ncbi:MAG TPA: hypothetical protein EYP74_06175, partial [Anaerolineales bacterium]|nr:hypothetical protein [Anaerolineales bacterium]